MQATINLINERGEPRVMQLRTHDGRFLVVDFGGCASVILPGFDGGAAACARKLANALTDAAATLANEQAAADV